RPHARPAGRWRLRPLAGPRRDAGGPPAPAAPRPRRRAGGPGRGAVRQQRPPRGAPLRPAPGRAVPVRPPPRPKDPPARARRPGPEGPTPTLGLRRLGRAARRLPRLVRARARAERAKARTSPATCPGLRPLFDCGSVGVEAGEEALQLLLLGELDAAQALD